MTMTEFQKEVNKVLDQMDSAYCILSTMPVSGDNVPRLAAAESKLKRAYNDLKALSEKEDAHG